MLAQGALVETVVAHARAAGNVVCANTVTGPLLKAQMAALVAGGWGALSAVPPLFADPCAASAAVGPSRWHVHQLSGRATVTTAAAGTLAGAGEVPGLAAALVTLLLDGLPLPPPPAPALLEALRDGTASGDHVSDVANDDGLCGPALCSESVIPTQEVAAAASVTSNSAASPLFHLAGVGDEWGAAAYVAGAIPNKTASGRSRLLHGGRPQLPLPAAAASSAAAMQVVAAQVPGLPLSALRVLVSLLLAKRDALVAVMDLAAASLAEAAAGAVESDSGVLAAVDVISSATRRDEEESKDEDAGLHIGVGRRGQGPWASLSSAATIAETLEGLCNRRDGLSSVDVPTHWPMPAGIEEVALLTPGGLSALPVGGNSIRPNDGQLDGAALSTSTLWPLFPSPLREPLPSPATVTVADAMGSMTASLAVRRTLNPLRAAASSSLGLALAAASHLRADSAALALMQRSVADAGLRQSCRVRCDLLASRAAASAASAAVVADALAAADAARADAAKTAAAAGASVPEGFAVSTSHSLQRRGSTHIPAAAPEAWLAALPRPPSTSAAPAAAPNNKQAEGETSPSLSPSSRRSLSPLRPILPLSPGPGSTTNPRNRTAAMLRLGNNAGTPAMETVTRQRNSANSGSAAHERLLVAVGSSLTAMRLSAAAIEPLLAVLPPSLSAALPATADVDSLYIITRGGAGAGALLASAAGAGTVAAESGASSLGSGVNGGAAGAVSTVWALAAGGGGTGDATSPFAALTHNLCAGIGLLPAGSALAVLGAGALGTGSSGGLMGASAAPGAHPEGALATTTRCSFASSAATPGWAPNAAYMMALASLPDVVTASAGPAGARALAKHVVRAMAAVEAEVRACAVTVAAWGSLVSPSDLTGAAAADVSVAVAGKAAGSAGIVMGAGTMSATPPLSLVHPRSCGPAGAQAAALELAVRAALSALSAALGHETAATAAGMLAAAATVAGADPDDDEEDSSRGLRSRAQQRRVGSGVASSFSSSSGGAGNQSAAALGTLLSLLHRASTSETAPSGAAAAAAAALSMWRNMPYFAPLLLRAAAATPTHNHAVMLATGVSPHVYSNALAAPMVNRGAQLSASAGFATGPWFPLHCNTKPLPLSAAVVPVSHGGGVELCSLTAILCPRASAPIPPRAVAAVYHYALRSRSAAVAGGKAVQLSRLSTTEGALAAVLRPLAVPTCTNDGDALAKALAPRLQSRNWLSLTPPLFSLLSVTQSSFTLRLHTHSFALPAAAGSSHAPAPVAVSRAALEALVLAHATSSGDAWGWVADAMPVLTGPAVVTPELATLLAASAVAAPGSAPSGITAGVAATAPAKGSWVTPYPPNAAAAALSSAAQGVDLGELDTQAMVASCAPGSVLPVAVTAGASSSLLSLYGRTWTYVSASTSNCEATAKAIQASRPVLRAQPASVGTSVLARAQNSWASRFLDTATPSSSAMSISVFSVAPTVIQAVSAACGTDLDIAASEALRRATRMATQSRTSPPLPLIAVSAMLVLGALPQPDVLHAVGPTSLTTSAYSQGDSGPLAATLLRSIDSSLIASYMAALEAASAALATLSRVSLSGALAPAAARAAAPSSALVTMLTAASSIPLARADSATDVSAVELALAAADAGTMTVAALLRTPHLASATDPVEWVALSKAAFTRSLLRFARLVSTTHARTQAIAPTIPLFAFPAADNTHPTLSPAHPTVRLTKALLRRGAAEYAAATAEAAASSYFAVQSTAALHKVLGFPGAAAALAAGSSSTRGYLYPLALRDLTVGPLLRVATSASFTAADDTARAAAARWHDRLRGARAAQRELRAAAATALVELERTVNNAAQATVNRVLDYAATNSTEGLPTDGSADTGLAVTSRAPLSVMSPRTAMVVQQLLRAGVATATLTGEHAFGVPMRPSSGGAPRPRSRGVINAGGMRQQAAAAAEVGSGLTAVDAAFPGLARALGAMLAPLSASSSKTADAATPGDETAVQSRFAAQLAALLTDVPLGATHPLMSRPGTAAAAAASAASRLATPMYPASVAATALVTIAPTSPGAVPSTPSTASTAAVEASFRAHVRRITERTVFALRADEEAATNDTAAHVIALSHTHTTTATLASHRVAAVRAERARVHLPLAGSVPALSGESVRVSSALASITVSSLAAPGVASFVARSTVNGSASDDGQSGNAASLRQALCSPWARTLPSLMLTVLSLRRDAESASAAARTAAASLRAAAAEKAALLQAKAEMRTALPQLQREAKQWTIVRRTAGNIDHVRQFVAVVEGEPHKAPLLAKDDPDSVALRDRGVSSTAAAAPATSAEMLSRGLATEQEASVWDSLSRVVRRLLWAALPSPTPKDVTPSDADVDAVVAELGADAAADAAAVAAAYGRPLYGDVAMSAAELEDERQLQDQERAIEAALALAWNEKQAALAVHELSASVESDQSTGPLDVAKAAAAAEADEAALRSKLTALQRATAGIENEMCRLSALLRSRRGEHVAVHAVELHAAMDRVQELAAALVPAVAAESAAALEGKRHAAGALLGD